MTIVIYTYKSGFPWPLPMLLQYLDTTQFVSNCLIPKYLVNITILSCMLMNLSWKLQSNWEGVAKLLLKWTFCSSLRRCPPTAMKLILHTILDEVYLKFSLHVKDRVPTNRVGKWKLPQPQRKCYKKTMFFSHCNRAAQHLVNKQTSPSPFHIWTNNESS